MDLRRIAQVVIPEGTERIGNHWFWGSDVVSVTIPASVAEIGVDAFCKCAKLTTVVFQRYPRPERARGGSVFSCCMGKTDDEEAPFVDSKLRLIDREAFCGCSSLRAIDLPDSVEEIGLDSFYGSGLEAFTAPKALRVLRQSAFEDCKSLKRAQLNEGLETLGSDDRPCGASWNGVFEDSALESVVLPSTLRRIEHDAFAGCENLRSVGFPDGLERLGLRAFLGSGLERAELPASLRAIGQGVFAKCKHLRTVTFGDGLEVLGENSYPEKKGAYVGVFEESTVESVRLPSTLRRIEYDAFNDCKELRQVRLLEGLEYIGRGCFYGSGLEGLVLPSSVREVGPLAFTKCARLRSVELNEGLERLGEKEVVRDQEVQGKVFMESALEGVRIPSTLKVIELNTFADCAHLRTVEFAEGLEEICPGAFRETAVERVVLPASTRTVHQAAFAKCGHLKQAVLNEGLEALGMNEYDEDGDQLYGVFHECALEDVCLPSTLKRIEYGTFQECEHLSDITLPEGLEFIGRCCFFKSGLEEIVFPASLREVGARAFQLCKKLRAALLNEGLEIMGPKERVKDEEEEGYVFAKSGLEGIAFPSTLKEIPQNTFWDCESLSDVRFAEGLERIGLNAFQETAVEQVTLPASLRVISQGAFCKCAHLWKVQLSEGLEALGVNEYDEDGDPYRGVFEDTAVEAAELPATLKRIEYSAFKGCKNLADVRLPDGLWYLGSSCFRGCRLADVTLPARVEEIGEKAFYGNALRAVRFAAGSRLRLVGDNAFGGNEQLQQEAVEFPAGARVSDEAFEDIEEAPAQRRPEGIEIEGDALMGLLRALAQM